MQILFIQTVFTKNTIEIEFVKTELHLKFVVLQRIFNADFFSFNIKNGWHLKNSS